MKTNKVFIFLLLLLLSLGFAGGARAQAFPSGSPVSVSASSPASRLPDQVVLGDNYTLKSGETLTGNLWVLGGNATIENGARVTGDIRLLGGNLTIDGEVEGSIAATGGTIALGSTAHVYGNIDYVGGSLQRENGAQVDGQTRNTANGRFLTLPGIGEVRTPDVNVTPANPVWSFFSFLFWCFMMTALAVLAVMFLPRQIERAAQTVFHNPVIAGGVGCLTIIIVPLVLVAIMITIVLIPVSLAGLFILGIAGLFGWVTIGTEVGHRLAQQFHKEWALPVTAGAGTFLMTFVLGGIGQFVACIGWIVPTLAGVVGLGAVLLTRFGTRPYPEYPVSTIQPTPPQSFEKPEL